MLYLKSYLIALVIFFGIDIIWLGTIAQDLYQKHLGFLLKENFNMTAAVIFYLFFIAGLVFLLSIELFIYPAGSMPFLQGCSLAL